MIQTRAESPFAMFSIIVISNETVCGTSECVCVCVCARARVCVCAYICSVMSYSATPWTVDCQIPAWNFSGKNTRVGCHFLFQGIFPTQGLNLCLIYPPALTGRFFTPSVTWKILHLCTPLILQEYDFLN